MAKKSKRTLDKSDTTRTVICSFCGKEHRRRSKEIAECRDRHRRGLGPAPVSPVRESSAARTLASPEKKHPQAVAIRRLTKDGHSPRRIAKVLDLNIAEVQRVVNETTSVTA